MKIFKDIFEWKEFRSSLPVKKSLGVVMTMGALHDGHLSLIRQSKKDNDYTLATIFLNPTQFENSEDLTNYPKTQDQDVKTLGKAEVDFLLMPSFQQIYFDNYTYKVSENELSLMLCGSRTEHFDGVLTVVMKLLNIAKADRTYFGEKDYQQFLLIKGMAKAFFMDTKIISCETIREKDGLAVSSRNLRLTTQGRKLASFFAKTIRKKIPLDSIKNELEEHGIEVDYIEEHFGRRFVAVFIDNIRLIDNFEIRNNL